MRRPFKLFSIAAIFALLVNSTPLSTARAGEANNAVQSAPNAPLLVPNADTVLSIHPLERVMIGEDFEFYASFDNFAETGYGPFIDLIFPTNGADGAAGTDTPDGIDFVSGEYDGQPLTATSLVFPDDDGPLGAGMTGCVDHPLAVDPSGSAVQVCGTAGDTLTVLELPFSSVTQGMPTMIYVDIMAHVSSLADVDTPLTILGRGGYRFGADSLNNPSADPAILTPPSTDGSGWPSLEVTPHIIAIEKSFNGHQECPYSLSVGPVLDETQCYGEVDPVYESVSGPNFPGQYDINIYVAAGQTVTDLDVTDDFPNNLAFLSVDSLGGGTLVDSPTVGAAANPPDNDLIVNFPSLTGSTDILVSFFIPEFDADGNPVLDPTIGDSVFADNIATALGDWTPVDPRDPGGPDNAVGYSPCGCVAFHSLDVRSLAVQKSVEIVDDVGAPGYSPGDLLKYTLDFQISDYFGFGNLVLTDVLADGQSFANPGGSYPPVFSVSDRNTTLTDRGFIYSSPPGSPTPTDDLTIDESQIGNTGVPADGTDGSTTLTFDISKAMLNIGAADGVLQGGEAGENPPGSGTPATGASPAFGSITFYAVVQEDFSDSYPSGDSSVDHSDVLFNSVTIAGTIANEDATLTTNTQNNDSIQKAEIVYGDFEKSIYAVNGSTSFTPEVQPGDTITFRLRQDLPSSDSDFLALTDFLPLPIFEAAEITTFDDVTDATEPAAGHAKFGPDSTLNAALALPVLPTISADATNNSLTFDFGSFDDPSDTPTTLDILFTVTVSNAPYMDSAALTNLAFGEEDTTNNGQFFDDSADRFTLKGPRISLRKGVVASDNLAAVFVPNPPGPVAFNAPGSNPSWSGVIASGDNDPSTDLINSDLQNVESGDLLTFALVIENLGRSSLGAFDISLKDSLPANLQIPAGGINLQARRGDGAALTFSPLGSTATEPSGLFDDGIVFSDESGIQGVAHVYDPANGQNLIVITYDLQLATNLPAGIITNTATLLSYAGTEGGPNHVGAAPTNNIHTDDATVSLPNSAPVITEGASTSVTMSENGSPTPFSLTLHATDANGDPLTWSILTPAAHGTAGAAAGPANSSAISYTPLPNYRGVDTFVVEVSDGALRDSITVNVTVVRDIHTAPVITEGASVAVTMSENGNPTPFALTLHTTDANADPLTWSILTPATTGTASVGATTGVVAYTPPSNYYGTATFVVQVSDGDGGTDSITVNVTVVRRTFKVFLPIVARPVGVPDLVVTSISLVPSKSTFAAGEGVEVRVTVTNQGSAAAEEFWVDLYINPSSPPTAANQVWNTRCGLTPCFGMAWVVTGGLAPGQSITLSSSSPPPGYSVWPGYFAAGTTDLYAYADSYNPGVAAGAAAESNETNNRAELHGLTVTGPNPSLAGVRSLADVADRPRR